jgi:hypothetical protein
MHIPFTDRRKTPRPTPTGPVDAIVIPGTFGFLSLGTNRRTATTAETLTGAFITRTGTATLSGYTSRTQADHHASYLRAQ